MVRLKTVLFAFFVLLFPGLLLADTQGHRPKLVVTPSNLNFFTCALEGRPAPAPESKTLKIRAIPPGRDADCDPLDWTATPTHDWIAIEPSGGTTPSEAKVSVKPARLAVGEHKGYIRFDTPGQKKPRWVRVKLRIFPPLPGFTLRPERIDFSGEAFSNVTLIDSVRLGVVGADKIEYTASNSQSWLTVIPEQAEAPQTVLLLAKTDSLPAGTYHDTVVFKARVANGDDDDDEDDRWWDDDCDAGCVVSETIVKLPVTLILSEVSHFRLVVTPQRLGFAAVFGGSNPQPQNLMVSSLLDESIPWKSHKTQSWLNLVPDTGIATLVSQSVQVSIDIAGLNPGLYTDTITVSPSIAEVLPAKVPVFLQIFPPSELTDSVAIGDGLVDLTDPQINRFSVPIFASNTQAVRAIALPLHFEDGQTNLDSVTFAGGRAEFADLKLFLRLSEPGDFLVLVGFVLAPALPPGEGTIGWLHFTTTGVLPQFADTLIIDSTSVPNATGDPNMPQSLSVSYLVFSGGNPLILNPAFKKGMVILRNQQVPTSADDGDGRRPLKFGLNQNYPNPFNPQTAIAFSLPKSSEVRLEVFDLLGRSVVTLQDGSMSAGTHTVVWDGRDKTGRTVSSGVYLYRLQAGSFVETKKMLFLK